MSVTKEDYDALEWALACVKSEQDEEYEYTPLTRNTIRLLKRLLDEARQGR